MAANDDEAAALESSFFAEPRAGLRARLRQAERDRARRMEALAEISGIEDVEVLEQLVLLGVRSETLAALTLYPLVAVAWADGNVDAREREAVLRGAEQCGLSAGGVAHDLIASWLDQAPDEVLARAWRELVKKLVARVSAEWRVVFARELLARASAVADASGGFLALDRTSGQERRVLDGLRAAFE